LSASAFEHVSGHSAAVCEIDIYLATGHQSMIPKKPAPDLIRGGYRFLEKHAPDVIRGSCSNNKLKQNADFLTKIISL
jgi:hypothetical protein